MGCYDMVVGNFVCPYCNELERVVLDQTKAGDCTFQDFGLGDYLQGYYDDISISNDHKCKNCGNEYSYIVEIGNETMYSIIIIDKVFNKQYIYKNKEECHPKKITEEDLKNFAQYKNKLQEILEHNTNKIKELQQVNQNVEQKIKILEDKINREVYRVYK